MSGDSFITWLWHTLNTYRLTPFSIVSSTRVDASWTKVRALALEKPDIADDSESEERRDWSNNGDTAKRGPFYLIWHEAKHAIRCAPFEYE